MQQRLGTKFILIVVGILSVTLVANAVFSLRSQNRLLEEQLVEQGQALGHFVALVSPEAILGFDFLQLNEYAREVSLQRNVIYGVVVDPSGQPMTSFINADNKLIAAATGGAEAPDMKQLLARLQALPELIALEFPIVYADQTLGFLKLGLSRAHLIQRAHHQLWIQFAAYSLITLFLSGAIYLAFCSSVLRPVQRLIRASQNVEKGEYRTVEVKSRDEIGSLAKTFNSMVRSIRQERGKLHHQANYDPLTGLPNRMLAAERLSYEINRARRDREQLAVLFIDLDDFKVVNDTMGHATGDQLLVEIGLRLKSRLRDVDTIARLGGDEFLILLPKVSGETEIEQVTERLTEAVCQPLQLQAREVKVFCSIGVALFPDDGLSAEKLMSNADNAMYQAKNQPRSSVCFFTREMNIRVQERMQMEQDLNQALDAGELDLVFQPIIDAASGRNCGAEVLLRWKHPQKGYISPVEFIPLAELTGQIIPIGEWVVRRAIGQWAQWQQQGLKPGNLAINISRLQFQQRLAATVADVVAQYNLPAGVLELEITESVLLDDDDAVSRQLQQLRANGVKLALDDFGTGFSSLSYLKRFRFDVLKIDRCFVQDLPGDAEDASLVKAIIAMAHSMDMKVVAEGVETPEQFQFLCAQGCDFAQGYLFSKPLDRGFYQAYLENAKINQHQGLVPLSMTIYPTDPGDAPLTDGNTAIKNHRRTEN